MGKKKTNKQKKVVALKQYMVSGAKLGAQQIEITYLILATSPVKAAQYFKDKHPDMQIWGACSKVANSTHTEDDIPDHWMYRLK